MSVTTRVKQAALTAVEGVLGEPAVAAVLDPERVSHHLGRELFGGVAVESCRPHSMLWEPNSGMRLRYGVRIPGHDDEMLVLARIFEDGGAARRYYERSLAPLARQLTARPEVPMGCRPAAVVQPLSMAVSLWPLDGELPGLIGATDPAYVASLLEGWGLRGVAGLGVARAHYGRRNRCVLQYSISQPGGTATLYGKVSADGRGQRAAAVIDHLGRELGARAEGNRLLIPRLIGYAPDLELLVLDEVPGRPVIGSLVKRVARGIDDGSELAHALTQAAAAACTIHESDLVVGRRRDARSEVESLIALSAELEPLSESVTRRVSAALNSARGLLGRLPRSRVGLAHGDFSHTQLLLNPRSCGLVDFDTTCCAEAALDLGHFTAYVRLLVAKAAPTGTGASLISDRLCAGFLGAYQARSSAPEDALSDRAAGYELLSLARLALHSIQKMKTDRQETVLSVLEERAQCLES